MHPNKIGDKLFPLILFFKDFIYLCLERGKEGEREGVSRSLSSWGCLKVSQAPPTVDLACNPGMCPDWEWNR